jgi:hypothetical protein
MKKPTLNSYSGRRPKTKGAAFERLVCRQLSLWISGGKNANLFWRSSMSGGRATIAAKKGEKIRVQSGDIAAIDPAGHPFLDVFYVECKRNKTVRLDRLFYPMKGKLLPIWETAKKNAAEVGKVPLLIVKEDGRPILLVGPAQNANLACQIASREFCFFLFADVLASDPKAFLAWGRLCARSLRQTCT